MTDSPTSRRAFLRATAAGTVAVVGGRAFHGGSTANTGDAAGKLVFTYDDGPTEDYTEAFEKAHQPEGVPASTAIPSARLGSPGTLDADQVDELVAAGWEVMSHTVHHRALTSIGLTRDVAPGDDRVYVASNLHGKLAGDRIELFDGTNAEVVTVAGNGEDERGQYVRLEEPTDHAYAVADDARERYTDAVVRSALEESQNQLERELGVEVTNVVMPYAGYGRQPRRMVADYYAAVANAGGFANGDEGLNPIGDLDLPHLSRRYFREGEMTRAEIRGFLDRVADEDVVGILGGHTWRTGTLPAERIRWTIQEAKDRDVEIVTLRQALADRGDSETTTETTTDTTTRNTTDSTTTETTETTTHTTTSDPTTTTTSDPSPTETTPTRTTTTETTTTETTTETTTRTTTETTTSTTTADPTTTETTTETTTHTTSKTTTAETTTADTTTAEPTTTGSGGSNGGGTGGTGGTGNTGGGAPTPPTESTTGETATTAKSSTTATATTETTTETTSRMAVRDDETRTATKVPTNRTMRTPTTQTATETSSNWTTPEQTSTATGTDARSGLETTAESATTATESSGVDWDALGWIAALGGTGSVAAYLAARANGTDDGTGDE